MLTHGFHRTILLLALASLSGFAAAAGSQAGDNGRQPLGADNEGPRQAVPNASMADDGAWSSYDASGYYRPYYYGSRYYYVPSSPQVYYSPPSAYYYAPPSTYYYAPPSSSYYVYSDPTYYGSAYYERDVERAWAYCDTQPLAERAACRDAAAGRH